MLKILEDPQINSPKIPNDYEYWIRCPWCGEVYNRAPGPGKHMDCINMATVTPPLERRRRRWNDRRNRIAPKVFERDGYACKHCGTIENLTVDHIVAMCNNGSDDLSNLQTLCGSCNSKKGAK